MGRMVHRTFLAVLVLCLADFWKFVKFLTVRGKRYFLIFYLTTIFGFYVFMIKEAFVLGRRFL